MKTSRVAFGLVAVLGVLGLADVVWAWGPATHVGIARDVLAHANLLPTTITALLAHHQFSYLFGSIAADVVFAKRLSRVKQFCHHWSTAFRMVTSASTDEQRSFAYGYLSHLAADTVAHGKYVPRQIVASKSTVNFGHLYWELRADAIECESSWSALMDVLDADQSTHLAELRRHMTGTFLPFELNKVLFQRVNSLTVRGAFRRTIDTAGRLSRYPLSPDMMNAYRGECVDRVTAILSEGASSALLQEDPNGTSAFMQIRVFRRDASRMRHRGASNRRRLSETSRMLAPCRGWIADHVPEYKREHEPVVVSA